MAIPSQTLTELNPGLAAAPAGADPVLFVGPSSSGTANTIKSFGNLSDLVSEYGQGPLVEYAARALKDGGPVLVCKSATSTAASESVVAVSRVGTSTGTIVLSNDANDFYDAKVEITATGDLGVGKFKYSLDGGRTYSRETTIPAGGAFTPDKAGITLTFTENTGTNFQDGDVHTFTATPAMCNATDIGAALDALIASAYAPEGIVICGRFADASTAAAAAATLATKLDSLDTIFRFAWAAIDAGGDNVATTISGWASHTDDRIAVCYGTIDIASQKPYAGFALPARSVAFPAASRIKADLISTHTGRVANGSISGVAPYSAEFGHPVSHDEYRTGGLDSEGFLTVRTWPTVAGYYFTRGRLKSGPVSDFQRIELRRVMNAAKRTAQPVLLGFVNSSVRTNANGTIREADARRIEARVNAALSAVLLEPSNAEGTDGHVSGVTFRVDRSNNIAASSTLQGTIEILSLAYIEQQVVTVGFIAATADAA